MRDVLARGPDRVPVDRGGAVVAPTRPWRVSDLGLVACESVVGRGPGGDHVHIADPRVRVNCRVCGARVVVVA